MHPSNVKPTQEQGPRERFPSGRGRAPEPALLELSKDTHRTSLAAGGVRCGGQPWHMQQSAVSCASSLGALECAGLAFVGEHLEVSVEDGGCVRVQLQHALPHHRTSESTHQAALHTRAAHAGNAVAEDWGAVLSLAALGLAVAQDRMTQPEVASCCCCLLWTGTAASTARGRFPRCGMRPASAPARCEPCLLQC